MTERFLRNVALLALLAGTAAQLAGVLPVFAQEASDPRLRFAGGLKTLDLSKGRIEMPVKGLMSEMRSPLAAEAQRVHAPLRGNSPVTSVRAPVSQKVEPGKVRWHKAVQTAMDASARSGKPVLLFQMMGRLDDRFC